MDAKKTISFIYDNTIKHGQLKKMSLKDGAEYVKLARQARNVIDLSTDEGRKSLIEVNEIIVEIDMAIKNILMEGENSRMDSMKGNYGEAIKDMKIKFARPIREPKEKTYWIIKLFSNIELLICKQNLAISIKVNLK